MKTEEPKAEPEAPEEPPTETPISAAEKREPTVKKIAKVYKFFVSLPLLFTFFLFPHFERKMIALSSFIV